MRCGFLQAVTLLAVVTSARAFLATPLNASDPDVVNILCPEQTIEVTRDHKWITREAIRRNIRRFFLTNPPPSDPEFNVPSDASLSQLFHAYYGASASPARFINAVNSIAAANVRADSASQLRYDPGIHADGEAFDELQSKLSARYPQLLTSILVNEAYSAARSLLGLSLHSLQKFYAHSTWIEAGNTEILESLGLPGTIIEGVASPDDDVCTPCSTSHGTCSGNVVPGSPLTTGYYQYTDEAANDFLIPKPTTGGKCSHGGVLDETVDQPAIGGINKDTASPCFSPHHHLHDKAAQLAVQATDYYLDVILDAVGSDKYRRLFDLYYGTALSIVIDTTGSMSAEINAVKAQVEEIVTSIPTEVYVLVPYNDPSVGPVTKTHDPDEFMRAVNKLSAGGGGDIPEMYWTGLELAITNTPDYGSIFTFTDASGKDGDIMEGVISLAQERNIKVTVVFSGDVYSDARLVTDVKEYQRLADSTGGLFIPSGKFEIDAITPILGDSVQSVDVDITSLNGLTGTHVIPVPIDDSVLDFKVHLAGYMKTAVMKDRTGTAYNLLNDAALEAAGVEVITSSEALRLVRFLSPRFGPWTLDLGADSSYSVTVSANTSLSWLGGFSILDPSPPHPHYRTVEGRPLTKTVYYVDVTLIGYLENNVINVHNIEYIDKSGVKLRDIPYHGEIDDEFYIRSDPLPEQPFNMRLCGYVQSGNEFCRLLPVLISAVQASVDVLATSEELSARPGESASGDFLISNFGLESDFTVTITDDMKYFSSLKPTSLHLKTNASGTVTATFQVPSSSIPGTVSTITLTAQSVKQTESVNSAITQLIVLPLTQDTEPPLCSLDSEPDCAGYTYSGICTQKNWTATATLQDATSGLSNAYAIPDGFWSEVTGLTPSTTQPVTVSYGASCCTSQVDIIGVDIVGNVGKCRIDMGVLGGAIVDLEVEDVGVHWVMLRWSLTPTTLELHKYSLVIDDDFTLEFRCTEEVCHRNVTDLEPCSLHTFQLTPYFYLGDIDRVGQPAYTDATTLDLAPGQPSNGRQLNATLTTATVAWDTTNSRCIHQFQVCYHMYGLPEEEVCERTAATTYQMRALEPCGVYVVTVASLSPSGMPSEPISFQVNSEVADPEAPRNVEVELAREDFVVLTWDHPLNRVYCIDRYLISYGEVETVLHGNHFSYFGENHATVTPLVPCTNYTFLVAAVSVTGNMGPGTTKSAQTLEVEDPNPVEDLTVKPNATNSLAVSWRTDRVCVDHFVVCHYEHSVPAEHCTEVDNTETQLLDLNPCTDYTIIVTAVTPSGKTSNKTYSSGYTLEISPGEPQNLKVVETTSSTVKISYDPPAVGAQCVTEYDIQGIKIDTHYTKDKMVSKQIEPFQDGIFTNLQACTNYEVRVRSVTRNMLTSDWVSVNTTTQEEVPSAPRNLELLGATPTTLTIQWWEPLDNYLCVHEYAVRWTATKGEDEEDKETSQSLSKAFMNDMTLPDLTPCTEYTIKVLAVTPEAVESDEATLTASTTGCAP